jgi:hypothetical protein
VLVPVVLPVVVFELLLLGCWLLGCWLLELVPFVGVRDVGLIDEFRLGLRMLEDTSPAGRLPGV